MNEIMFTASIMVDVQTSECGEYCSRDCDFFGYNRYHHKAKCYFFVENLHQNPENGFKVTRCQNCKDNFNKDNARVREVKP